jgi:segregation and condensation protein B
MMTILSFIKLKEKTGMTENKKLALIEGLLFINGDAGTDLNDICFLIDETEAEATRLVNTLIAKFNDDEACGLAIQNFAKTHYRMVTRKEDAEIYKKLANVKTETKLSSAALEVLSIIAYRGPVSRIEVEQLRGVNCETVFYKLRIRDLIREAGKDYTKPGVPMTYEVTEEFMKYFNINSLDELPKIDSSSNDGKDLFANE